MKKIMFLLFVIGMIALTSCEKVEPERKWNCKLSSTADLNYIIQNYGVEATSTGIIHFTGTRNEMKKFEKKEDCNCDKD